VLHAVPLKDLKPHRLDTTCECEPAVEFLKQILVTHMAFDERQKYEPEIKHPGGWALFEGEDGELIDE